MDEREKTLPKWAQSLIGDLRTRLASEREHLVKELSTLRPKVTLLERQLSALVELLTCAAKGGHREAAEIVRVFESYSLSLSED